MAHYKPTFIDEIKDSLGEIGTLRYARKIIIGTCIIIGFAGTFFAYRFWIVYREQLSQLTFGVLLNEYNKTAAEKEPQWNALAQKFEAGYNKHSNSYLAPHYINFQVQILLQDDKKEEALSLLDKAVVQYQKNPLIDLYKTKRALIKLDMADKEADGLQELEVLAKDQKNQFHDVAMYYLGSYYWSTNKIEQARQIWQALVDEQRDERYAPSPWAQEVQAKLKMIL